MIFNPTSTEHYFGSTREHVMVINASWEDNLSRRRGGEAGGATMPVAQSLPPCLLACQTCWSPTMGPEPCSTVLRLSSWPPCPQPSTSILFQSEARQRVCQQQPRPCLRPRSGDGAAFSRSLPRPPCCGLLLSEHLHWAAVASPCPIC